MFHIDLVTFALCLKYVGLHAPRVNISLKSVAHHEIKTCVYVQMNGLLMHAYIDEYMSQC